MSILLASRTLAGRLVLATAVVLATAAGCASNPSSSSQQGTSSGSGAGSSGGDGTGPAGQGGGGSSSGGASSSAGGSSSSSTTGSSGGPSGSSGAGGGADAGRVVDASSGGDGGPVPSKGCGAMPTIPSSQYNNGHHIPITAANMAREYILNVPTNYDSAHPYKFVIAYHELNGNDDEMYKNKYYHLLPLSNDSTIFVAPNGQQKGANCTAASGCGWPNTNDSDMLLADAIVAQIEENFCIDTSRIFATGWSYGASMSYETACERPLGGTTNGVAGYVRAIAVYSAAQLSGSCKPTKPVAYYASHGTQDSVLCYDATSTNCSFASAGGGVKFCEDYTTVDGCSWTTPTKVTSGNHVCTGMTGCMPGYPVEFCSFNGPHTPDPTDPGQSMSWEYQNVWNFLSQF